MSVINYQRDMYIDVTALDVEWTEQAELSMRYGSLWADAKDECSRAEERIKLVRSELILEANRNPVECLGEGVKLSDVKVEAYYRQDQDYLDAKEDWLKAFKELNLIEIAKNEIAFTRKSALENLVTLHGQNYFAGPRVPRDLKKEMGARRAKREETSKEANAKVKGFGGRKRGEKS